MKLSIDRDWYEFLCALIDRQVKFLVVGGHAVAAHGHPRFTKDLDVLVAASVANGQRLRAALTDFGFGAVAPAASELAKPGPGWLLGRVPNRIDIITKIDGVTFARAWSNRVAAELDSARTVWIIARSDLIANKRAAARLQDLADVAALEAMQPRGPRRTKRPRSRPT